jgi:hypothetical protein
MIEKQFCSCSCSRLSRICMSVSDCNYQMVNKLRSLIEAIAHFQPTRTSIGYLKVEYLLPVFNGDVVFEFPSISRSSRNSNAKLMVGMDKRLDKHAWIRTSTSHIKNDMGLMFRTASCVRHLRCDN